MEEVKDLMLQSKAEYEEREDGTDLDDGPGLKSPPLTSGEHTSRRSSADTRRSSATPLRSPKLPQIGYFSAPSPNPAMKRTM